MDLRANEGSDMVNLDLVLGQQVWESGVGILAVVIMLKELKRRISRRLLGLIFMAMRGGIRARVEVYLSVSLSQTGRYSGYDTGGSLSVPLISRSFSILYPIKFSLL